MHVRIWHITTCNTQDIEVSLRANVTIPSASSSGTQLKKLTNIERPNHVALDEETGGFQPIFMASRTDNRF